MVDKQERERYNAFKRTFRHANWYIAKKRGDRYYRTVHAAYQAQITGSTLDRFIKESNGKRACHSTDASQRATEKVSTVNP